MSAEFAAISQDLTAGSPMKSSPWIASRSFDSVWFIGSAFSPLLFVVLHAFTNIDMFLVWLAWVGLIDTPHYFGTYLRTYFDKEQMTERGGVFKRSLLLLLVGPLVIGLSFLLHLAGASWHRFPISAFIMVFNFWAYWHLVRQHYGILKIYHGRERAKPLFRDWEGRLLQSALWSNFLLLGLRHPEARAFIGLSGNWTGYPQEFAAWEWSHLAHALVMTVVTLSILALIGLQLFQRESREKIRPAFLFTLPVILSYVFVTVSEFTYSMPLLIWTGMITIGHNFQYHAIVWLHQYNRNKRMQNAPDLAVWISEKLHRYILFAVLTGIVLRGLGCVLEIWPGCGALISSGVIQLFGKITLLDLFFGVMLGIAMHHYYLDQLIWHPGKDQRLKADLRPLTE